VTQPVPGAPGAEGVPTCYRHPGRESYIRCQRCDRPICPECMRDAAVGFQCVECVKKGVKDTRSGRTAYGGLRPTDASATSMALIAVNVGVWIAIVATGWRSSRLLDLLALLPAGRCDAPAGGYFPGIETTEVCSQVGGTFVDGVAGGAYWQLVTSSFTQVEIWHIGFNMLALWVLGPQLELAVGRARFLALYMISGLASSALILWAADPNSSTVGASGAIFGLMGALLVVAYKVGGDVQGILTWIGINFLITLLFINNISWQGHLGGFLGGMAVAGVLVYAPKGPRRTSFQLAGLAGLSIVVLVALVTGVVALQ
jgi:membrane associated rhomboid family serine protease